MSSVHYFDGIVWGWFEDGVSAEECLMLWGNVFVLEHRSENNDRMAFASLERPGQ